MIRTKTLIDKKFQLKTTFRIIGIIIIAFIFIIAVTGIISTSNNDKIRDYIKDLNLSIKNETKTIEYLMQSSQQKQNPDVGAKDQEIIDYQLVNSARFNTNIKQLNTILKTNQTLVIIMIITGILLGGFLFIYLLRITHRISGPIYVLTRHMQDIMDGKDPDLRELRKNDEFKEFYQQFIDFIQKQ
jgi:predicted PurR-regulated permease PerM